MLRKKISFILLIVIISISIQSPLFSSDDKDFKPGIDLGLQVGLSTPNDQINNIYNKDVLEWENSISRFIREGAEMGYNVGVKARFSLSQNYKFYGGLTYHIFPGSNILISNPDDPKAPPVQNLYANQTVLSLGAGLNLYLLKTFFQLYGTADLQYNYLRSSVDFKYQNVLVPLSSSPSYSRVGIGFGAGMDIDFSMFVINLEGKYNIANLIGQEDGEKMKSYFTLCACVYL